MSKLTSEKVALALGYKCSAKGFRLLADPSFIYHWRTPDGRAMFGDGRVAPAPPDYLHDLSAAVWEVLPRLGWRWNVTSGAQPTDGLGLCREELDAIRCWWFKTPDELATAICQAYAAEHPEAFGARGEGR